MQLEQLREHLTPLGGRNEGQKPLKNQHQGDGRQDGWPKTHSYFLAGPAGAELPRIVLKKSELLGSRTMTSLFLAKLAL
jgi:hypothetical protein